MLPKRPSPQIVRPKPSWLRHAAMPKRSPRPQGCAGAKRQRIDAEAAQRHWKAVTRVQDPAKASPAFTKYYRAQFAGLLKADEWEAFFRALSLDLPVTVRLNVNTLAGMALDHRLATEFQFHGQVLLRVSEAALPFP